MIDEAPDQNSLTRREHACTVVVRPAGAGREALAVLCLALAVVAVCGWSIGVRAGLTPDPAVEPWRMDAFADLAAAELAVFNALRTAAPEIEAMHEESGQWPTMTELEGAYIDPFVRDLSWRGNGALAWTRSVSATSDTHIALYLGSPEMCGQSRSLLLLMSHDHVRRQGNAAGRAHPPHEIWLHPACAPDFPEIVTDQALISAGWREVTARTGDTETRRARGAEFLQ